MSTDCGEWAAPIMVVMTICTVAVLLWLWAIEGEISARLDAICQATPTCEVVTKSERKP